MRRIVLVTALALPSPGTAQGALDNADLQFFGDLFLAKRPETPYALSGVKSLLESASHNVVNFEGVVGDAFVPIEVKQHLLQMAPATPTLLRKAGITIATLANNHSMDFGYPGLMESVLALRQAGVLTTGAGKDAAQALRPLVVSTKAQGVCLLALSRTLPDTFWAKERSPGAAFADFSRTSEQVRRCRASGLFTVAIFHWGRELTTEPIAYQRELGRIAIDAGADLVIGHHPHVLQRVEIYKNKPIFYSLGNFAFGSLPPGRLAEGAAVRVLLPVAGPAAGPIYEVVPLNVDNAKVRFVPRPLESGASDPMAQWLAAIPTCKPLTSPRRWRCQF